MLYDEKGEGKKAMRNIIFKILVIFLKILYAPMRLLKPKNKKISKNIKTQNQLLNRSDKSKNIDKEDREREE